MPRSTQIKQNHIYSFQAPNPLCAFPTYFSLLTFPQLGHNGVTPESCWLVDELSVAVPTKGIKYIFQCKCWLAKDRGDGLTARLLNVLDSSTINIIRKVSHCNLKYNVLENIQLICCMKKKTPRHSCMSHLLYFLGSLFSHSCHRRHSVCRNGY